MFNVYFYYLVYFLIVINRAVKAADIVPPASDFGKHSIVQPIVQHARTKREIITTRDEHGTHHPELTMKIHIDGEDYILDLWLNHHLVSDNHVLTYEKDGKTVHQKPTAEEMDLCHYGGSVRGKPDSRVALSTCHGVQGIMYDGEKMRYIEPAQGGDISSKHYMYDHADLSKSYKCGNLDSVTDNSNYDRYDTIQKSRVSRYKRHAPKDTQIRGPYNENKDSRYVELLLVVDYSQFRANNADLGIVHRKMATLANIINSFYAPLNIFIALVGVEVWNHGDKIRLDPNSSNTLNNFIAYRNTTFVKGHDNAHLLTGQHFEEAVIGKASTRAICSHAYSGGVATNHSEVIGLVAATIAHEMGHNFGMDHDTNELCDCPKNRKCIMSPSSSSVTPVEWSSCSLHSLAMSFQKGLDYCLRNKPKSLPQKTCGNGFVEPGEECDCGTMPIPGSYNPCHACCEPNTCKLRSNATCATGLCCDLQTCRPKSAGTVCRSAELECDLPEYCTGHSEYCPDDVFKIDTTPCREGAAYCMRGRCRTHSDQCRLLWGLSGKSGPGVCYYNYNIKGNGYGNCGYDYKRGYLPCSKKDALCGRLQCLHLTNNLEFGSKYTYFTTTYSNGEKTVECHAATIDMGINDVDPGLVPDGAKCGDGKMCLQQKCISVESKRQSIAKMESSVCPSDCSGHGVCNSAGQCHCDRGFLPPLCAQPGPGGSDISGPATDPNHQKRVMIAIYVIFLGIVPSIAIILYLIYYCRPSPMMGCNAALKKILIFFNLSQHSNVEVLKQEHLNSNNCNKYLQLNETIYANCGDVFKQQTIEKPPRKINIGKSNIGSDGQIEKAIIQAFNIRNDNVYQTTTKNILKGNNDVGNNNENDDSHIYVNQDFLVASVTTSKGDTTKKNTARKNINKNNIEIVRQDIGKGDVVISVEGNLKNNIENAKYVNKDFQLASKTNYKGNQKSKKYVDKDNDETIRPTFGKGNKLTNKNIRENNVGGATNVNDDFHLGLKDKAVKEDITQILEGAKYIKKHFQLPPKDTDVKKDTTQINTIKMNKDSVKVADNRQVGKKPVMKTANTHNFLLENNKTVNVKDLISTMNNIATNSQSGMIHNSNTGPSDKVARKNVNVHGFKK